MRVFVSYSKNDETQKKELLKHLAPAIRAGLVSPWDPSQVLAGDEHARVIEAELEQADVALVLLSAAYLESDGPADHDLVLIEKRRLRGELRVVPILLSACAWQAESRIQDLQVLPRDHQSIEARKDRQEALVEVCKEIVALSPAQRSSAKEQQAQLRSAPSSFRSASMDAGSQSTPPAAQSRRPSRVLVRGLLTTGGLAILAVFAYRQAFTSDSQKIKTPAALTVAPTPTPTPTPASTPAPDRLDLAPPATSEQVLLFIDSHPNRAQVYRRASWGEELLGRTPILGYRLIRPRSGKVRLKLTIDGLPDHYEELDIPATEKEFHKIIQMN